MENKHNDLFLEVNENEIRSSSFTIVAHCDNQDVVLLDKTSAIRVIFMLFYNFVLGDFVRMKLFRKYLSIAGYRLSKSYK